MNLFTLVQVHKAANLWYGKSDIDHACLAENRLMRGERPEWWKEDATATKHN